MNRNISIQDERAHLLLAMDGHDLKEVLGAVCEVLNTYSQETGKYVKSSDASFLAVCVEDMQCAGNEMLLCIDEMMAILDEGSSALEPLRGLMQLVYGSFPFALKPVSYVAANGQYEADMNNTPSHLDEARQYRKNI
jgi:hypothetical protein